MESGESRERMNWRVATERKAKEIADAKEVEEGSPSQNEGSAASHPQAPSAMSNDQDATDVRACAKTSSRGLERDGRRRRLILRRACALLRHRWRRRRCRCYRRGLPLIGERAREVAVQAGGSDRAGRRARGR